jgi:hypothetical protein
MRGIGDKPSDHALPGTVNLTKLGSGDFHETSVRKLVGTL